MTNQTKFCRIIETDSEWVTSFKAFLVENHGAMPTAEPTVLEVPQALDLDAFHGTETYSELSEAVATFAAKHADAVEWLEAYSGNFEFYLSLKTQYAAKGTLSDKQLGAVYKAIAKDAERSVPKTAAQVTPGAFVVKPKGGEASVQAFSLKPGAIIQVTKWAAAKLAEKAGYVRPHFAFEVVSVEAETGKALRLTVRMTAQRTSFCSCCGLALTNPESVAAGIGPICAEKAGVDYGDSSLAELAAKLAVTVAVTDWLPKGAIKTVDGKPFEGRGY